MRGKRIISDRRAREKPCLRCGYSLRNLGDSRHCPECGLSAWVSLNQNDGLEWSNPLWLRWLTFAAYILAGAQTLGFGVWLALRILQWRLDWAEALSVQAVKVLLLLAAIHLLAFNTGILLLASPEHRYPDTWRTRRWTLVGFGLFGILIGLILAATILRSAIRPIGLPDPRFWANNTINTILISSFVLFIHLQALARRMGRIGAAKLSTAMFWFTAIAMLAKLRLDIPWILDLLLGAYLLASLTLFFWFAAHLRQTTTLATSHWASETAAL